MVRSMKECNCSVHIHPKCACIVVFINFVYHECRMTTNTVCHHSSQWSLSKKNKQTEQTGPSPQTSLLTKMCLTHVRKEGGIKESNYNSLCINFLRLHGDFGRKNAFCENLPRYYRGTEKNDHQVMITNLVPFWSQNMGFRPNLVPHTLGSYNSRSTRMQKAYDRSLERS